MCCCDTLPLTRHWIPICIFFDQGLESSSHLRPPISDPPSQTPHLRPPSQATISGPHLRPSTSDPPSQAPRPPPQTPRYSSETTISGPDNVGCYVFRARLQYQAPNMAPTISDPRFFVWDYNIRPRQCRLLRFFARDYNIRPRTWHLQSQTPRFWCETTISGPEHDTYNLRPHAFRVGLQYQAPNMTPTISDPALFVRDYNNDQKPSNRLSLK